MTQDSNQQAPADDERLRAYVDAVGIHDERLRGYVEAIGLGACDGTDCEDCVGAAKAAMAVAGAEQAELRAENERLRRNTAGLYDRAHTAEAKVAQAWDEGANAAVRPVIEGARATLKAVLPFPENPYRSSAVTDWNV